MALGIYKPGQGYWMRVFTAAMVGTIFLASAMWVAGQAKRISAMMPVTSYSLPLRAPASGQAPAAPTAGARVTLLGEGRGQAEPPVVGTAIVERYDADNRIMIVKSTEITNTNYDAASVKRIQVESGAGAAPYTADLSDTARPRAVVEPILIQGIAASVVLILGAILTYWLTAIRPKTVDFLINTDMEMKKVNWSTRKDIIGSTWVVIGSSFLIAAFIFLADTLMQALFKAIGVLQG